MFQSLRPCCVVPLLLWLACRPAPGSEPSPSPNPGAQPRLGACTAVRTQAAAPFPDGPGHKLLVVDFFAADRAAQELGHERALAISRGLPLHIQKVAERLDPASGLQPDELRLRYIPCVLSTEEQAHDIGQAWGADSVLWGTVQAGAADQPAQLALTLTAVQFRSEARRTPAGRRLDPDGVPDVAFSPLPAPQVDTLYPALLAVHAFRQQRYRLVASALSPLLTTTPAALYPPSLLSLLGHSLIRTARGEAGLEVLKRARALCGDADRPCQAIAEAHLAWALGQRDDRRPALAHAEQAVTAARQSSNRLVEVAVTNLEGDLLDQFFQPRAADERYQRALRMAQEQSDVPGQLQALINLSLLAARRELDSGRSSARQALSLATQHARPFWQARARVVLGMELAWAEDYAAARVEYQAAFDFMKRHADLAGQQRLLRLLGSTGGPALDRRFSEEPLAASARLAQQMGDVAGEARTRSVEAKVARLRGDRRKARQSLEQEQDLWRRLGSISGQIDVLIQLAILSVEVDQRAQARTALQGAQALAEQAGEPEHRARVLREQSRLWMADNDLQRALEACEQARQLMQAADDAQGLAEALLCAARVQETRRDLDQARALYEQAFTAARTRGAARLAHTIRASLDRLFDPQADASARIAYFDRLHFGSSAPQDLPWPDLQKTLAGNSAAIHLLKSFAPALTCGALSLRYRLCALPDGSVDNVMALHQLPEADEDITKTLRSWRFAPRSGVACSLLDLRFKLDAPADYCAERRNQWQFLAPQIADSVLLTGRGALPWPLQPPLNAGEVRSAVYRLCYDAAGNVAQATAVRGLEGGDAVILPKLREQRIQPLGVPVCTLRFLTFRGQEPLHSPPAARVVPAVRILKEAIVRPDPHLPDPVKARLRGQVVTASYKLCVAEDGSVNRAEVLRGIPGADETILNVVAGWRYKPQPVPICFIQFFEYHISD